MSDFHRRSLFRGVLDGISSDQKLVLDLIFTFGVVERVRNLLSSDAFAEIKSILAELCDAFPILYKKYTDRQYQILHTSNDDRSTFIPDDNLSTFTTDDDRSTCPTDDDSSMFSHDDNDDDFNSSFKRIRDWIGRLRRTAYDIEDMVKVAATEQLQQRKTIVDLSSDLRIILSELEENFDILDTSYSKEDTVASEKSDVEKLLVPPAFLSNTIKASATSLQLCSWEDTIVGREPEKKQIVDWIFNSYSQKRLNILSISGTGGIGKTTLAKMVYNDVQVSTNFDLVLWAVTFSLDLKNTVAQIVKSFTGQSWFSLQKMDLETLKATLHGILKDRKYFLILDSFETGEVAGWEELRETLEVGSPGSTVILIIPTDCWWVVEGIRYTEHLMLPSLPENHSWSLFSRCVGFDADATQEYPFLKQIGRSIVNKCDGCPQAIKTLGSLLRNIRDEHLWKQIYESTLWTIFAPYTAYAALAISFENMSYEMVQCLVPLALLKIMSRDHLVYFWMAQGLLQSREGNEDPIDVGDIYCNELLLRNYIQLIERDGEDMFLLQDQAKKVVVDMMREEVALISDKSFSETRPHLIWNGGQSSLNNEFTPGDSTLPNVRTFLFQNYVGPVKKPFLEGLISKLSCVRVLLLDGSEFEELPDTIGSLKLLRYLSLAGNHTLRRLPESICELLNLQTLDLSGCEQLRKLPKYMHKLASLRHLFLSLKLIRIPEEALKSLCSLHHLKICYSPNLNSLPKSIHRLTALRVLQIHDCPMITSLPNNRYGLTCLKELSILNCEMLDLTKWDGLYGLRGLRFLKFQGLPNLRKLPVGILTAIDSLQHLIVKNCENLAVLPDEIHGFQTLQLLKIVNCPKLATLPLKEQPGEVYDKKRLGKQEEVKEVERASYQDVWQGSRNMMEVVFKVNIDCQKCKAKALKKVAEHEGVYSICCYKKEKSQKRLRVIGNFDSVSVAKALRKIKMNPEIISVGLFNRATSDGNRSPKEVDDPVSYTKLQPLWPITEVDTEQPRLQLRPLQLTAQDTEQPRLQLRPLQLREQVVGDRRRSTASLQELRPLQLTEQDTEQPRLQLRPLQLTEQHTEQPRLVMKYFQEAFLYMLHHGHLILGIPILLLYPFLESRDTRYSVLFNFACLLLALRILHALMPSLGSQVRDQMRNVHDACWHSIRSFIARAQGCGVLIELELSKELLLLLGEGYEFEKDKLIQLWMAAGFIEHEPMEIHGANYFGKLISEGYILCSESNFLYKVNSEKLNSDLHMTRGMSNYLRLESTSPKEVATVKILHVSVVGDDINDKIFKILGKFRQLRTLLFYGSRIEQVPIDLFLRFESLSVLDLSRTYMKELPTSALKMVHLRYLDLSWTLIELLPETISRFKSLQTLKLIGCSRLWRLPREMSKLVELRHLDFDILGQLTVMPRGIGALLKLRTLSAFIVGTQEGCKITELKTLNNLTGEFCIARLEDVDSACLYDMASLSTKKYLKKLELRWSDFSLLERKDQDIYAAVLENLCPHPDLEELLIGCYGGINFPRWVGCESFHKLASITLFKCEHVSMLPSLQKLPSLEYLGLISLNSVIEMDVRGRMDHVAFPKLQILIIDEMLNLSTWMEGKDGDFSCLVELTIKHCPNIPHLPSPVYLSTLKRLEISSCPKVQFVDDKQLSTCLEFLIVEDCPIMKETCLNKEGKSWDKIKHVRNVWIDHESMLDPTDDDDNSEATLDPTDNIDSELMDKIKHVRNVCFDHESMLDPTEATDDDDNSEATLDPTDNIDSELMDKDHSDYGDDDIEGSCCFVEEGEGPRGTEIDQLDQLLSQIGPRGIEMDQMDKVWSQIRKGPTVSGSSKSDDGYTAAQNVYKNISRKAARAVSSAIDQSELPEVDNETLHQQVEAFINKFKAGLFSSAIDQSDSWSQSEPPVVDNEKLHSKSKLSSINSRREEKKRTE